MDGRLSGVRSGHLLHEDGNALFRAKCRYQHCQEGVAVNVELGANRLAVAHRRIVSNPACDHTDGVGPVAVAQQPLRLTR